LLHGTFWHQGPTRYPLTSFPDPAVTDGRYHQAAGPGVWYASDQEQAAWAELFRHFLDAGVDPFEVRRRTGKVDVANLEVLDLTDPGVRAALGVEQDDLVGDEYTKTQQIAQAAASAGFGGILAPSAALPGRRTLAVFGAGILHVTPGPSRVAQPPPRLADLLHAVRAHPDVPATVRTFLGLLGAAGSQTVRRLRRSPPR
jgi:RES domain-containing protein